MTVEAVLVFLVLLCCFMFMLNVAKLAVLEFEMQTIVSDVADRMAGDAYLLSKLNGWQDKQDEELINNTIKSGFTAAVSKSRTSFLAAFFNDQFFTDKSKPEDAKKAEYKLGKATIGSIVTIVKFYINKGINCIYEIEYDKIAAKKIDFIQSTAESCAAQNIENAMIGFDKNNLQLDVVKMPQTSREYESSRISLAYIAAGITPDYDFEKDDVVISLSYKYIIKLPFLGTHEIILRKTAIEKAWLNGGDGIVSFPRDDDNLLSMLIDDCFVFLTSQNAVYVAEGNSKFHKDDNCRNVMEANCVKISKKDADRAGYKECEICG